MSTRTRRMGALVGGAAVLSFGGYAIGSQAGDGVAESRAGSSNTSQGEHVRFGGRGGPGGVGARGLDNLADKLGVSAAKLEDALADIRAGQQPPAGDPRDRFAAGLASKLGIDESKVRAALEAQHPDKPRERRGQMAAALAKELGIGEAKVRAALRAVKPARPGRGGPPDSGAFLADLSKELGVSEDKLREALDKVHPGGPGHRGHGGRRGPEAADTAALAKALGVDEAKLKTALDELRSEHQAEHEKRRDEFAQALADRLGIDVAKVKDALPIGPPHHGGRGRP